jgi:hypothetical protein
MDPTAYDRLRERSTAEAHYFNTRITIVLDMISGHEQGNILDVGCGPMSWHA